MYLSHLTRTNSQLLSLNTEPVFQTIKCGCRTTSNEPRKLKNATSNSAAETDVRKWTEPIGYQTPVKVYNRLLKKNVPLILRHDKLATWYTCGPTVYDECHIGHASTYVKFDIIRRILIKFFSIDIVFVMGITDIDDKIIKKARELNMDIKTVAKRNEYQFFSDISKLKILHPTVVSRVTEHIPEIIGFIKTILDNGLAYVTPEGTVYFDVIKYGKYGRLSNYKQEWNRDLIIAKHKHHHKDFALWKATKPGEPWWESPWGKGRPGWHIECSAMASCILGKTIDIHSGGIDLLFPHHENEEAQCGACHGVNQWVNYWIHSGHLHLKGDEQKMSKSLKNTISIKQFLEKYSANHFRLMCLRSNYKNDLEYSESVMLQAIAIHKKLESFFSSAEAYIDGHLVCNLVDENELMSCLAKTKTNVQDALAEDFDTSGALKQILLLIQKVHKILDKKPTGGNPVTRSSGVIAACYSYVDRILSILGVRFPGRKTILMSHEDTNANLTQILDSVVKFRSKVRTQVFTTGKDAKSKPQESVANKSRDELQPNPSLPTLPDDPPEDKGDIMWTTKSDVKSPMKMQRKEKDPILQACDEIRNELLFCGIQIKDHGKDMATWTLHEDKSLLGVRSSMSDQDPYEPNYNPKERKTSSKEDDTGNT